MADENENVVVDNSNIITITYDPSHYVKQDVLFQYDQGRIVRLEGFTNFARPIDVHISNSKYGTAGEYTCEQDEFAIPDSYMRTGRPVYIWLYLKNIETIVDDNGEEHLKTVGRTVYQAEFPVKRRAGIAGLAPPSREQDAVAKILEVIGKVEEKIDNIGEYFKDGVVIFEGMNAEERNEWENGHT